MAETLMKNKTVTHNLKVSSYKILIKYKGKNNNFIIETPDTLNQVIKLNIKQIMHLAIQCNKKIQHPLLYYYQNALSEPNHKKISDKPKLRNSLQNKFPVVFKNTEVIKTKKKKTTFFQTREGNETKFKHMIFSWT